MSDYRINMDIPRFQLDRRPGRSRLKLRCPKCGKERCLTPYVDVTTGQPVGDEFGRCDHERKCGYDNRPKGKDIGDRELWVSNNEARKDFKYPQNPDVINYIPMDDVLKTVYPDVRNVMFEFLSIYFNPELVESIFRRYYVGTMDIWKWKGCPVFWQIGKDYICRTGKVMEYYIKRGENCIPIDVKRVKEGENEFPHVTFYHSLKGTDYLLRQCLFGEHLLNHFPENETVNVVESEKTAIICSINKPKKLFLATGGLQNLRPEVMGVLKGRKIIMHPDKGSAFDVWEDKVKKNLPYYNIKVSDYLQNNKELEDGEDIADLIIKRAVYKNEGGY